MCGGTGRAAQLPHHHGGPICDLCCRQGREQDADPSPMAAPGTGRQGYWGYCGVELPQECQGEDLGGRPMPSYLAVQSPHVGKKGARALLNSSILPFCRALCSPLFINGGGPNVRDLHGRKLPTLCSFCLTEESCKPPWARWLCCLDQVRDIKFSLINKPCCLWADCPICLSLPSSLLPLPSSFLLSPLSASSSSSSFSFCF